MKTVTGHRSDSTLQECIDNTDAIKIKSSKVLKIDGDDNSDSVFKK